MKNYFALLFVLVAGGTFAQTKTSGVKALGSNMSIQVDVDATNNLVTYTFKGPSAQWFSLGLNATSMSTNNPIDCISYSTTLLDQHLSGGHNAPITDATSNLTLVSNTVSGTARTIVATRPLNTGDTNDYTYVYQSLSSLNIIYAYGSSTNISQQHANEGSTFLSFTSVLGNDQFEQPQESFTVYPNPSNGIFLINSNNHTPFSKMKVYNTTTKLIQEVAIDSTTDTTTVDLSKLSKGIYFIEISNETDTTVKKIEIK